MKIIIFLFFWLTSGFSKDRQIIEAIGVSPKGQFIAVEEYGFDSYEQSYFSRIKFVNVWKKKSISEMIEVRRKPIAEIDLIQIRKEAKEKALKLIEKYNIVI
jgi:predicted secreted protein